MAIYLNDQEFQVCPFDDLHVMSIWKIHDHILKCDKNPKNRRCPQPLNRPIVGPSTLTWEQLEHQRTPPQPQTKVAKSWGSIQKERRARQVAEDQQKTYSVAVEADGRVKVTQNEPSFDGADIHDYEWSDEVVDIPVQRPHYVHHDAEWSQEALRPVELIFVHKKDVKSGKLRPTISGTDISSILNTNDLFHDVQDRDRCDSAIGTLSAMSRCSSPGSVEEQNLIADDPSIVRCKVSPERCPVLTPGGGGKLRRPIIIVDRALAMSDDDADKFDKLIEGMKFKPVQIFKSVPRLSRGPLNGMEIVEEHFEVEDEEQQFCNCYNL